EPIHGDVAAGARKAAVCHVCHGVGASVAPTFPRLAGQRPDYLYHRLVSFKAAGPKDPYYSQSPMSSQAANLSDADMRDLAAYYAVQTPTNARRCFSRGTLRAEFPPVRDATAPTREEPR